MTTTTPASPAIVRLLAATTILSLAALGVGLYGVLRPTDRPAAVEPGDLAAIRQELAALRHSVEVSRNQQPLASTPAGLDVDAERRLARLEASVRAAAAAARTAAPADTGSVDEPADPAVMPDGTSRFTSLRPANSAVRVEQSASGALVVTNRDPALTGQRMIVRGRTVDDRDEDVAIVVPPPG